MPAVPRAIRIGVIGGECTGKSTLAADLADDLSRTLRDRQGAAPSVAVVGEQLREFVARNGRTPRMAEQAGIMAAQQEAEDQAAQASDLVIADPAAVLTAVYSELYFSDGRLWPAAASAGRGYALLLWCRPDLPWEADPGQRDGPAHRQQADEIIARAVRDGTLMALPVDGNREHRRRQAVMHAIAALRATGVWRESEPGIRT